MDATRLPSVSSPRFRVPSLVWVGIGLLAVSVAGVAWGLNLPGGDSTSAGSAAMPTPQPGRAVCIGYVDVRDGVIPLYPLLPGQVEKIEDTAREGAREVEKGTPLFHLDDTIARAQLAEARAGLADAEAQLKNARALPAQHEQQLQGQRFALLARQAELEAARLRRADTQRKVQGDVIGAEAARIAAENVKALEAAVEGEQAKLRALELVDPTIAITRAEQDVARRQADVQKAEYGLKECTVVAPCRGTTLRLLVAPGQVLGTPARQPALWFCPAGKRIIRAEVYQEFANRVVLGQSAQIQDDTRAGPTWKGKVVHVSDWYTQRRNILLEPLQFNDVRTLECIVEPDDPAPPLRIGQRVRVTLDAP